MKLELQQVVCKGVSGSVNSESVTLTAKFECPWSAQIADKLGLTDHVYDRKDGELVLRRFSQHGFAIGFEKADLYMMSRRTQTPNKPAYMTAWRKRKPRLRGRGASAKGCSDSTKGGA